MSREESAAGSATRRDPVASLAGLLRSPGTSTAARARLRRADPRFGSRDAVFEAAAMFAAADVRADDPDMHRRWFTVLHCLALADGRHDPRAASAAGAVLARIGFKEARMRQLVEADADTLIDLVPRIARRLAAQGAVLNWWPLADLLLHAGTGVATREERADAARRRLVEQFVRASNTAQGEDPT